jgi:putative endonuclease
LAPKKTWYFYVLSCKDLTLYTGVTTDVDRRVKEHNAKKGAKYTRGRTPVRLFYYREMKDRSSAQKLENAFKKLSRSKKLERLCEMVDEDAGFI